MNSTSTTPHFVPILELALALALGLGTKPHGDLHQVQNLEIRLFNQITQLELFDSSHFKAMLEPLNTRTRTVYSGRLSHEDRSWFLRETFHEPSAW